MVRATRRRRSVRCYGSETGSANFLENRHDKREPLTLLALALRECEAVLQILHERLIRLLSGRGRGERLCVNLPSRKQRRAIRFAGVRSVRRKITAFSRCRCLTIS